MTDKRILLILLITAAFVFYSCKTPAPAAAPVHVVEKPESELIDETPVADEEVIFDPEAISREIYDTTKVDVQNLITELNKIIAKKDFRTWTTHLSEEYYATIQSKEFLAEISEWPALKASKTVLRTAQDYFTQVVVKSRANIQEVDIEFISRNRVKAFTVMTNRAGEEQKLRVYDLEKIDNVWKIAN